MNELNISELAAYHKLTIIWAVAGVGIMIAGLKELYRRWRDPDVLLKGVMTIGIGLMVSGNNFEYINVVCGCILIGAGGRGAWKDKSNAGARLLGFIVIGIGLLLIK